MDHNDSRRSQRSRSPSRSHHRPSEHRHRSPRSHHHRHHSHRHHHRHRDLDRDSKRSQSPLNTSVNPYPRRVTLPYNARELSKDDFTSYKHILASYLDIQKQIWFEDLDEKEQKGRWKSFLNKWNRGELAQGWYDPETKQKADAAALEEESQQREALPPIPNRASSDDSDEDYGPELPSNASKIGPATATFSDLATRDEMIAADAADRRDDLRYERKMDRKAQKEQLDELVPRAEAGTRERQLEKKREKADAARSFRNARGEAGDMAEVGEGEMMGGGGGIDDVKRMKVEQERRKNERQIKREEMFRARAAEREERMQGLKAREDKTMEMLKAIAKERFG